MNIWVNGCFDIIHSGHIDLLWYAKLHGIDGVEYHDAMKINKLFVGLDSDERVKFLKGEKRPINGIETRQKIMSNLKMVDSVTIFHNEKELEYFIKVFNIDYMVIGDQYKDKRVIGAELTKYGVIYYPTDERSSTSIVEKIKKEAKLEIFEEMYEEFKDNDNAISFNNYAVAKLRRLRNIEL